MCDFVMIFCFWNPKVWGHISASRVCGSLTHPSDAVDWYIARSGSQLGIDFKPNIDIHGLGFGHDSRLLGILRFEIIFRHVGCGNHYLHASEALGCYRGRSGS